MSREALDAAPVDALLEAAENMLSEFRPDHDTIEGLLKYAVLREPKNAKALAALGGFYFERGEIDKAVNCLVESDELDPLSGPAKLFCLGQIFQQVCDSEENEGHAKEASSKAVHYLERGLRLAEAELSVSDTPENRSHVSEFLVALGEHFMTPPACDDSDAEEKCTAFLERALCVESSSVSALTAMATLKKVVGLASCGLDEATAMALAAHARCKELVEASLKEETMLLGYLQSGNALSEEESVRAAVRPPSPAVLFKTAQLLADLDLFSEAADVLEYVVREDDTNPEVWAVLVFVHCQRQNYDDALCALHEFDDRFGDVVELAEQMRELKSMVDALPK